MTSSFGDPTVRSNFYRQFPSPINQRSPSADEHAHFEEQNDRQTRSQHGHQQSQSQSGDGPVWQNQDVHFKPWSNETNVSWYRQAFPGAHHNNHAISTAWEPLFPQTHASPSLSDGDAAQANHPQTNNWLLQQQLYQRFHDLSNYPSSWSHVPTEPNHCDMNQHEYFQPPYDRPSFDSVADMRYSDLSDGRSENMSVCMDQNAFPSSEDAPVYQSFYSGKSSHNGWGWHETSPSIELINTPMPANDTIPYLNHTPETARFVSISESSPPAIEPGAKTSPNSSLWDDEVNNSFKTTNTPVPRDLIPNPPTELLDPPVEDMHPSDKTMIPQRRNLKNPNHLYMPRWIRGDGKRREGWCGACRPGKWLSLKRSTYWYHKNFCHGITVMGTPFPRPTQTRPLPDEKGYEGHCGSCNKWITLNGGKKSHTSWFRHAYKCDPSAMAKSSPPRSFF